MNFIGANRGLMAGFAERELMAVEHPCHVVDARRAVETLGGGTEIARAFFGRTILQCSLRSADPLSHQLYGERVATPALLLRVRRRRGSSGPATAEVVGKLTHSVRFAGLADFQYVSHPRLISALSRPWEQWPAATAAAAAPAAPDAPRLVLEPFSLSIPPSTFFATDLPQEFLPRRPLASKRDLSQASTLLAPPVAPPPKRRRRPRCGRKQLMHFGTPIDFDTGTAPREPPDSVRADAPQRGRPSYPAHASHAPRACAFYPPDSHPYVAAVSHTAALSSLSGARVLLPKSVSVSDTPSRPSWASIFHAFSDSPLKPDEIESAPEIQLKRKAVTCLLPHSSRALSSRTSRSTSCCSPAAQPIMLDSKI